MIRRSVTVPFRCLSSGQFLKVSSLIGRSSRAASTYCSRSSALPCTIRQNRVAFASERLSSAVDGTRCALSTQVTKSDEAEVSTAESSLPSKDLLFQIDWMFEILVSGFMKARLRPFLDITNDDVVFEETIFNYKFSGKSQLSAHIAKVRAYYRYLSPYNKMERVGSCIYESEDVVVVLWRLSSLRSSFLSYLPKLMTNRQDEMNVVEGALDVHVTKEGRIYRIVNRKVTASDLEGAKVMADMKKEVDEERRKQEKRRWARQLDDMMRDGVTR